MNENDGKVPIRRLRSGRSQNRSTRTGRACNTCRQRKWKCDGNRPMCDQCQSRDLGACVYSKSKRSAERTHLDFLNLKVEAYEKLLRDISLGVDAAIAKRIARALKDLSSNTAKSEHPDSPSSASSSSFLGSLDGIDSVNEDLNRSEASIATGYMGKNSEVAWMQRLESEATKQASHGVTLGDLPQYQLP